MTIRKLDSTCPDDCVGCYLMHLCGDDVELFHELLKIFESLDEAAQSMAVGGLLFGHRRIALLIFSQGWELIQVNLILKQALQDASVMQRRASDARWN